jgi:acyl-CoA reductase-like NAD-dependent aldehyde dehydrogenase
MGTERWSLARRALEAPLWAGTSPRSRTCALLKIEGIVDRHAEELAALATLDNGTPLSFSTRWAACADETFRYYIGRPTKILGTTNPTDAGRFIYMLREPISVCALRTRRLRWLRTRLLPDLRVAT